MAGTLTVTQAACHIPELWSRATRDAVEANLCVAQLVDQDTVRGLVGGPGDIMNIPYISNVTASTKTANSNISYEVIGPSSAEAAQLFSVATHQYSAFAEENITAVQSQTDLMRKYTGKAGYALAAAAETNLHTLPQNFSNIVGTVGIEPTFDNWLRASQYLDDANAPEDSRFCVVRPATYYAMRKLDQFTHGDLTASFGKIGAGRNQVGTIFSNVPVYKTTLVRAPAAGQAENWFCHKKGIYYCSQFLKSRVEFSIDMLSMNFASEHVYGYAEALQPPITAGGGAATDVFNVLVRGVS